MATLEHRVELHNKLVEILGSQNVYFQPPSSLVMKYPCIVYHKSIGRSFNADNATYLYTDSYDVTVLDKNPDSQIPDKLIYSFEMIRRQNPSVRDGIYHTPFVLYY